MKSPLDFFFSYEILSKPPETPYSLLINKKTKEHLLLKEVQLESHNLKEIVETLEEHRSLEHEHLLGLIDYSIGEEEGQRVMRAFYNVGTHSLLQEIRARQEQSSPLEEQQLWGIIYGVVMALAYLQKNNIGYGVISLDSIYLTADGKTKVVDPSVASNPLILNPERYYSPEMLKILHQQNHSNEDINIFKSDVFVLAMCIIHCSILQPINECIDYDSGEVDFDMLEETLSLLPESYSQELVKLVVKMLDENAQTRPDFLELQEYLSQVCTSEEAPARKKGHVTIAPMTPDPEDIKGESVYPNEFLDLELIDRLDGEDESEQGFEMPKLSMARPKESPLQNTLNLSDSLSPSSPNDCKTFASSRNSSDLHQYYSVHTQGHLKSSVKGSKHIKEKVMQNQNIEELGPPEATESRSIHLLQSSSLAPYLPQKRELPQLFTDPKLLLMLKEDLRKLSQRTTRAMSFDKQNRLVN